MHEEWAALLSDRVPDCEAKVVFGKAGDKSIFVASPSLHRVCTLLFSHEDFDFHVLQLITGHDYLASEETKDTPAQRARIEVSYLLTSFRKNHDLILKVELPRENPTLDSVCDLWASANFQERECFDMVGVRFENHPDLRRILCPDDWEGYPLRRDYEVQKSWHGMEVEPEHKMNLPEREFEKRQKEMAAKHGV
ncbi:MAG: NADH-quinone oxidoreductase subunit C [Bacteriovoracales bacterium]|nr:NADH-quinone oxidoreductase subunit C [Bacteriovoracales bacterium]